MSIKTSFLNAACLLGTLGFVSGCFGDISYEGRLVPCDEGRCPGDFRCGNDDFCYPDDNFPPCKEVGAKIPCDESGTGGTAGSGGTSGSGGTTGGAGGGGVSGGGSGGGTCEPTGEEVCDGVDNDCVGGIDDGLPTDQECYDGDGVCRMDGLLECQGETGWVCSATRTEPPVAEEDGDVDPLLCDGEDNDCDGETDELNCPCDELGKREPCGSDAGICVSGERECVNDGGGLSWSPCGDRSDGTEYVTKETDDETTCDGRDEDCDGQVDESAASTCDDALDVWSYCKRDSQDPTKNASTQESCADVDQTCVEDEPGEGTCTGVCYWGDTECTGIVRRECSDVGIWAEETCGNACDDTSGIAICVDCVNGDSKCQGEGYELVCAENQWPAAAAACVDQTCTPAFSNQCGGECAPDQTLCNADRPKELMWCDAGVWKKDQTCPSACYGAGYRNAGCVECAPADHKRCQGNEVWLCGDDGTWANGTKWDTCSSVCEDSGGGRAECAGDCVPGKRTCNASKTGYKECDNVGGWSINETCTGQQLCYEEFAGEAECVDCTPGETKCEGNTFKKCGSDGTWNGAGSAAVDCGDTNETCKVESGNAKCGGVCGPTDLQCKDDDTPQTCVDGAWVDAADCASSKSCIDATGTCGGACGPTEKQCKDDDTPQTCVDGAWVDAADCASSKSCIDSTGACGGVCGPTEKQCRDDDTPQTCVDGAWVDATDCPSSRSCVDATGTCGGVCGPTEKKCRDNDTPQTCVDGTWVDATDCATSLSCVDATGTCGGVCGPTQKQCRDDDTPQTCVDGAWVDATDCATNQSCMSASGQCGGVCGPTEIDCVDSRSYKSCSDGAWTSTTTSCTFACDQTQDVCTGSCVPDSTMCENGTSVTTQLTCDDVGGWSIETDCAAQDQTCFNGSCSGSCAHDDYQCDANGNSERCTNGSWGGDQTCTAPDLLCNRASGQCDANPVFNIGNDSSSGGFKSSASNDYLYATPIYVDKNVKALRLGVLTDASSVGGRIKLALYNDQWDGTNHKPHQRLAYTSGFTLGDGAGEHMRTLSPAEELTPGTVYWVAVLVSELSSSGEQVAFVKHTPAKLSLGDGWSGGYVRWGGRAYTATPPWEWIYPDATYTSGTELSIFVEAQEFWK